MKRRGRPKGDTPPKTGSERVIAHRAKLKTEGKTELRGVFIGPKTRARLKWLCEHKNSTLGLTVGGIVRFAFEHTADPHGTKPEIEENL